MGPLPIHVRFYVKTPRFQRICRPPSRTRADWPVSVAIHCQQRTYGQPLSPSVPRPSARAGRPGRPSALLRSLGCRRRCDVRSSALVSSSRSHQGRHAFSAPSTSSSSTYGRYSPCGGGLLALTQMCNFKTHALGYHYETVHETTFVVEVNCLGQDDRGASSVCGLPK